MLGKIESQYFILTPKRKMDISDLDSPIVIIGDMNKEIKEDMSKKDIKSEESIYEEVHLYLSECCYPPDSTKQDKCIIRKRAKNFQLIDGILHYRGQGGSLR